MVPCGNRADVIAKSTSELELCLNAGGDTTLMVSADCDDDCADGNALRQRFWVEAEKRGITRTDFDRIVFLFAKDRIENWIEFLTAGETDESKEGKRVKDNSEAAIAARKLASLCLNGNPVETMPPSLQWSCRNWRKLVERMT